MPLHPGPIRKFVYKPGRMPTSLQAPSAPLRQVGTLPPTPCHRLSTGSADLPWIAALSPAVCGLDAQHPSPACGRGQAAGYGEPPLAGRLPGPQAPKALTCKGQA